MTPLDPKARKFLDALIAANVPAVSTLTPEEARQRMQALSMFGPQPEMERVVDLSIDASDSDRQIDIRVYQPVIDAEELTAQSLISARQQSRPPRPSVTADTNKRRAPIVFFHGGGFVTGNLTTHDGICRRLAEATRRSVVAVDYRLAPEHRYPAALEDAFAAVCWAAAGDIELGLSPGPVIVAGDSAGGNLAAVMAIRARDLQRNGAARSLVAGQVLLYPVLDHDLTSPSMQEFAEGYLLTRDAMAWFWRHYLPDPSRGSEPEASPVRLADLSGLAPAVMVTAGFDPLRDEGLRYAGLLEAAGVRVARLHYPDQIHDFLRRTQLFDRAVAAFQDIAASIKAVITERL